MELRDDLVQELTKGCKTQDDFNELFRALKKRGLEAALAGELTDHLGYDKHERASANQLKCHYDGEDIATNHLFASLVALTDNLNAVDLIELLKVVNAFKARQGIERDLLDILNKTCKTFSRKNYLRYVEQIDCIANQFSEPNVQEHFKKLMQGKFAKRFILQNADKRHLKDLMALPRCASLIKETLTMMLQYCKTMPFNHNVFELMVRLYLSNVDMNNHSNWSQILTLLREDITIGEALPIRNGAYRILASGFFCKRCAICADHQEERLHNDFKDFLKLDANNGFLFAKSAKNVADCPVKERLFNEIVKYYQHPSRLVYPLACNTLAESEEGMALCHVFTQLHQNETKAAQQRLRNRVIYLTLMAQGFFNNDHIDRLLDKIMRYHQGDLPAYFFTALAVLARNNTTKAVYVLQQCWNKTIKVNGYRKKLNKSLVALSECVLENAWKEVCQEGEDEIIEPIFNEKRFSFLASWWKNKNPVKPNPETLNILSHLLALRVAPNNLETLFQLGKMLNNPSIAVYFKQDFIHCCKKVQYQLFQQYIDALHHVNNERSSGQYALNQLWLFMSNELNPTRREGLNKIYSRAKCILNDKTRSRETHNLTANIVLRTVQFVMNPDDSNQHALNRVLQDKNARLRLGEKILRGIAIILSAVIGIGLAFAIPYGLSTIKKYQKSQLLEKTDLFVNQHATAASVA